MRLLRELSRLQLTHDPKVGEACVRIIPMRDGRIIADARATDERSAA